MADAPATTNMMADQADMSAPATTGGAFTPNAPITDERHPLATDDSYEGRFGHVLTALDQRVQATKQAAMASQQAAAATQQAAQAAAQRHVAVVSEQQRRMGALGSENPPGVPTNNGPQGALPGNQPAKSLQQYLNEHDDDTFKEAMDAIKAKHGKTPDELYDEMINNKFISPADQPLTKRQKAEAFTHIGLELLQNSTHRAGQEDLAGAFGRAGAAGEASIQRSREQAANQAHQEYLREQGLMGEKAKAAETDEKQREMEERQLAVDKAKNAEDWRKTQYAQGQENARAAERIASEDRKTASERTSKAGEKNAQTMIDADSGYQLERDPKTNRWKPSLDANGNPIKPLATEKQESTEKARTAAGDTKVNQQRQAYIDSAKKGVGAYKDDGTMKSDEELGAEFDKNHPQSGRAGQTKSVNFSSWK